MPSGYTVTNRSTTGCYTCKRRKKKCDERQPTCLRCEKAGKECEGYASLENPDSRGLMRRTRLAPSHATEKPANSSKPPENRAPPAPPPNPNPNQLPAPQFIPHEYPYYPPPDPRNNPWDVVALRLMDQQFIPSYDSPSPPSSSSSFDPVQYYPPANPPLRVHPYPPQSSLFLVPRGANRSQVSYGSVPLELHRSEPTQSRYAGATYGPSWPPPSPTTSSDEDDRSVPTEDDDPEGVKITTAMCTVPVLDSNTQNNALPFVLQCYARWVNFVVFDPLRVIGAMKDSVLQQFSSSEAARSRIILVANILGVLGKAPGNTPRSTSIVESLTTEAHRAIIRFQEKEPDPYRERDMANASKALDLMMEAKQMILIKRFASPLATVLTLMEFAAPVFRRACPDPPKQLVNIPNVLLSGNINLQNFVVIDILLSVTMARPMLFKYDTTYTPDTYRRMMGGECGFEWLYGIPDQFIVLFAWINSLAEDYGPNVDPQYVIRIEDTIREAKTRASGAPGADPVRTIRRTAVQECWRQTMYAYLYLVLCGVRADDPRVTKAIKSFVRLVNGVEAGRNPDFFLFIPIITIGAFVQKEQDRELIRTRLLGLRECSIPGIAGNVCLRALIEVWKQADLEQQAPRWSDLTAAYYRLIHV
ncbi:Protein STB5 [Saccharomyces cerevisiae S288c] [Rhizoctonia solani]|uniref:Protein STB5 [Saccharomyces cerevisiae S288c] n=1 Tax=Rhizoctonia solani TaxID=456999 RepID=A0A0K6FZR6_9AGAM|nr:Protein STB5 [Saccharomyces cerevisiae S288c] [Rhizoctonia solani]